MLGITIDRNTFERLKDKVYEVDYKGVKIKITPYFYDFEDDGIWFLGYTYHCPKCGNEVLLNINRHKIETDNNKITASTSLVCPHKCGLHTWLKDSIMTDC